MQRKFIHIFTITLLSLCLINVQTYAQEGEESEELPVKQEAPVLEKDSVGTEESVVEEPKSDMLTPILITPRNRNLLLPEGEQNSPKTSTAKPAPANAGEKTKEAENAPNLRFNLLYYLFYKVKVGSTSGTSN